jgi:hypothetical protein
MTSPLNNSLLASHTEAWRLPATFYSNWKAQGSYSPLRYVVRLRPDVHRALESFEPSIHTFNELEGEQILAFSTYLHETIHWWQHVGSTVGLMLSLLYPAQSHFNREYLQRILQRLGPFKSLRKHYLAAAAVSPSRKGDDGDINAALNNWHDMEFFNYLVIDPNLHDRYARNPFFDCAGHSFRTALSSMLWLLSSTFDPHLQVLPDPRPWEPEFRLLRKTRTKGFYSGSPLPSPPLGARALFEGQARFCQIQYLHTGSGGQLSWELCERAGMLKGIYGEAFGVFLKLTGAPRPNSPADPSVGLFLLICDLAINPSDGFPFELQRVPSVLKSIDPGTRFYFLCQAVARQRSALLGSIAQYSKEEYLQVSHLLCQAIGCRPPADIASTVARWGQDHAGCQALLKEDETFTFEPGNRPVRLFFARFVRYQIDKLASPEFFCWPGMWMGERPGRLSLEDAVRLFKEHEALFLDREDGDIYPRVLSGKDPAAVETTFNAFYAANAVYEMTRQWIVDDGEFELDFLWLTSKYSRSEIKDWAGFYLEQSYGVRPDAFRIL